MMNKRTRAFFNAERLARNPAIICKRREHIIGNLVEHQHATSLITEPYYALVCTITVRYHA